MRVLFTSTVLLALGIVVAGCGPQFAGKLSAAGGAVALKQECVGFLRLYDQTDGKKYAWMRRDSNYPPAIASFGPQVVSIASFEGVHVVDIQVSGGFSHHGLLVAGESFPAGFRPSRGSWTVWQLADGVWEYHE